MRQFFPLISRPHLPSKTLDAHFPSLFTIPRSSPLRYSRNTSLINNSPHNTWSLASSTIYILPHAPRHGFHTSIRPIVLTLFLSLFYHIYIVFYSSRKSHRPSFLIHSGQSSLPSRTSHLAAHSSGSSTKILKP